MKIREVATLVVGVIMFVSLLLVDADCGQKCHDNEKPAVTVTTEGTATDGNYSWNHKS